MQTQIHAESWMVLFGITPLKSSLSIPNPKIGKIKNSMPCVSAKQKVYVVVTEEQKEILRHEIRLLLAVEDKRTKDIVAELLLKQERESTIFIPCNDHGIAMSPYSIRDIVNDVKREIRSANPDRQLTHLKVIDMKKNGFSITEINEALNINSDYTRRVLIKAGLIDRARIIKPRKLKDG